jgi:general secretion pathway protein G
MFCQSSNSAFWAFPPKKASSRIASGFTLVELMVTLVILALLASVVTISVRTYLIRSKQNIAKVEIGRMVQAIETFYATFDRYPTNDEGIDVLVLKSEEFPEGLLAFLPSDPWGNPYEYRSPSDNDPFEITSLGADRKAGGSGADQDISSSNLLKSRRKY